MLTICQTYRLPLRQSLGCCRFRRHVHDIARGRTSPAQTQSHDSAILDPVPAICDALFENTKKRLWWYDTSNNREDAIENIISPRKGANLHDSKDTRSFNALISRYQKLGIPTSADTALTGIGLAAEEPGAMKEYLRLWLGTIQEADSASRGRIWPLMSKIFHQSHHFIWSGIKDRERKETEYFEAVTGYTSKLSADKPPPPAQERQPCLFHLCTFVDPFPWKSYIWLVSQVGGSDYILKEWYHYKTLMSERQTRREQEQREKGFKRPVEFADRHAAHMAQARNLTIRLLIASLMPEDAWRLTYEAENVAKDIEPKTWAHLLSYPQGLKEWIPEMNQGAIDMLDHHLSPLEGSLGVQWVGGEQGYHVPYSEGDYAIIPSWVNADIGQYHSDIDMVMKWY